MLIHSIRNKAKKYYTGNTDRVFNECKLYYLCKGQVLYDQLPFNPPGSEGSKGRWL